MKDKTNIDKQLVKVMLGSGKSISEIARAVNMDRVRLGVLIKRDPELVSIKNNNRKKARIQAIKDITNDDETNICYVYSVNIKQLKP